MHDRKWIILGIIVFLALFSFPFWANSGRRAPPPELEISAKAKAAKECVLPIDSMWAGHMQLLDQWRQSVVRQGNRKYISPNGKEYEISLSNTCLDCHSNKKQFCDRCHDYASVKPYCWDCHVDPVQGLEEEQ